MNKIKNFILCFLEDDCKYSSKKLLSYIFSAVVIYLVLFTTKDYYDILVFIAALLGLRTWERRGLMTKAPDTDDVNKQ
jgi:hypothetical protein